MSIKWRNKEVGGDVVLDLRPTKAAEMGITMSAGEWQSSFMEAEISTGRDLGTKSLTRKRVF